MLNKGKNKTKEGVQKRDFTQQLLHDGQQDMKIMLEKEKKM